MMRTCLLIVTISLCASFAVDAAQRTDEAPMMRGDTAATSNGWGVIPLLTIAESIDGYQAPGLLDGIGAMAAGPRTVRLFVNHELRQWQGYAYTLDNGTRMNGARISYFDLQETTLGIERAGVAFGSAYDRTGALVTDPAQINERASTTQGFDRFCSAMLVEAGNHGFVDTIYFAGEEASKPGHPHGGTVWALDVDRRTIWAAPALGRGAWENVTPLDTGDSGTVALLLGDDRTGAPLYLYLGAKDVAGDGSFLDRNGLAQGQLHVWKSNDGDLLPLDFRGTGSVRDGRFVPLLAHDPSHADESGYDQQGYLDGDTLRASADALGAFSFARPEDVHTNPDDASQAVLASTGGFGGDRWGTTYVVELDFEDPGDIRAKIRILYDGNDQPLPDAGIRSPDNLTWVRAGDIFVQEDRATSQFGTPTGIEASIWRLDPLTGATERVVEMDRSAVSPSDATDANPGLVGAWESSGVLDITHLFQTGPGEVLLVATAQAHGVHGGSIGGGSLLVEAGQLFLVSNLGPDPQRLFEDFVSTGSNQVLPGVGTLRHQNVYTASADAAMDPAMGGFLGTSLGLDAVDVRADGSTLFSVVKSGGVHHGGGFTGLTHDRVYELDESGGQITTFVDWSDHDLNVGSLDAVDWLEDGTLAFSTATTRGVHHGGGYTVLRPSNVYRFDPPTRTVSLLLDGSALGVGDVDGVDVLSDGRIAFSTRADRFVLTPQGGIHIKQQSVYLHDPVDGSIVRAIDGGEAGLRSLDAVTLGAGLE